MSQPIRARFRAVRSAEMVRLAAVALLLAVLGAVVVSHSDAAPPQATTSKVVATTAVMLEPVTRGTANAVQEVATSSGDWLTLTIAGCAALGLCCVLGLALFQRPQATKEPRSLEAVRRQVWRSMTTPRGEANTIAPSLNVLSISRT